MSDGFLERFTTAGEDGTAVANSTTPASILPAARKLTLPSLFFDRVGKELLIRAAGRISTLTAAPGTLTLDVRLGSIVVFNGGAMTLNTTAKTNVGWVLETTLVCRSLGAGTSATILGIGAWKSEAVIGSPAPTAGGPTEHLLPYNTPPVVGSGFDATAAQAFDLFATWSVANAANSITLHQFSVDSPT
jgi:hypothetical protein